MLSGVKLPYGYNLYLLPRYRPKAPLAEIILLTAYGTIPDGVRARKEGAFDCLTKGDRLNRPAGSRRKPRRGEGAPAGGRALR
ncbi:response regulator [Hymenobacter psychrophilus]|uniref:response regulator n=1 Tax=Hymenobacter psychrophilus TaxID=651662 RepID=UPI001114939D|nr:response regulator [Hymenobacter psychrophilus]